MERSDPGVEGEEGVLIRVKMYLYSELDVHAEGLEEEEDGEGEKLTFIQIFGGKILPPNRTSNLAPSRSSLVNFALSSA